MKKKINKKLLARIGAILACTLLVGALTVPCFAANVSAYDSFPTMLDPRASNAAFFDLISYYESFNDDGFFDFKSVVTGEMDINNSPKDFSFIGTSWSSDNGTFFTYLNMNYFVVYGYATGDDYVAGAPTYIAGQDEGRLEITLTKGNHYSIGTMSLNFYYPQSYTSVFSILYDLTFESNNITGVLKRIYFGNSFVTPEELYDVCVAFTPLNWSDNIPLGFFVNSVFNSDVSIQMYSKLVYSPYDYYQGYRSSYVIGEKDGYALGYEQGYSFGETNGYAAGQKEGFTSGYEQGVASSDGYQQGYNKAVSEIKSGEFGENLLGNMFSAPIKAVQGITLVHLPDGNTITLGNVFSALIALLLVLAFVKIYSR